MADTTAHTTDTLQQTIDGYFDCWNAPDEDARMVAIRTTWAEDATSTDPLADVSGHGGIAEMMAAFPTMYPGHSFRQIGDLDAHHDAVRWGWEMVDPDGNRVLDGIDVAWLTPSGKIAKLLGFFGAAVPGTVN